MKVSLSIETSGRELSVSLYSFEKNGEYKKLKSRVDESQSKQSERLVPLIDQLMRQCHLKRKDFSLVAVDVGPGSFTGVRVGVSVARTLAQGLELPLVGVSSLEAMAASIAKKESVELVVPWIPASTGEVYFAAYLKGRPVISPAWKPEEAMSAFLKKNKHAIQISQAPHADAVNELAIARYCQNPRSAKFSFENVVPLYLQPSWAERSKVSA